MLTSDLRANIIDLINSEVIPALGCTEPIAVALCAAHASKALGERPENVVVSLSANVLKNAMGVGIPGTGMIGLPIAIALGALVGDPCNSLEVLCDVCPEDVEHGRKFIDQKCVTICLKDNITEKLYIQVDARSANHHSTAIIAGGHTSLVYLQRDGVVSLDRRQPASEQEQTPEVELSLALVWEFAMTTEVENLSFILETERLNMAAAHSSLAGEYGHCVGRTLCSEVERKVMGDSVFSKILSYTCAACDARMAGAKIPVMSNSGSGNQGITATIPVVVYAQHVAASEDQLIRALVLSHLTVIYIKQSLGRLSALCGCVVAATGSSCAITYLMGGDYGQVTAAVKNMIANLTGMICDGAKPSCSMKLASGVSTAVISAMMAMDGRCVTPVEGIIDQDVDKCIRNLTTIGRDGMNETDRLVLEIMTSKC